MPTDLALINSGKNHVFPLLSYTEADQLAKVSGRYLKRPGSLRGAKIMMFFLLYRDLLPIGPKGRVGSKIRGLRPLMIPGCSLRSRGTTLIGDLTSGGVQPLEGVRLLEGLGLREEVRFLEGGLLLEEASDF